MGLGGQSHTPDFFTPGNIPGMDRAGGWVRSRSLYLNVSFLKTSKINIRWPYTISLKSF